MSADNFLVIREQPDGTFKVLEGRLSGWNDYLAAMTDLETKLLPAVERIGDGLFLMTPPGWGKVGSVIKAQDDEN